MRTPFLRKEAGSLINRTVTVRTKPRFRHPRTGGTALLLSTTTELFIIDLVAQHDPQPNAQLASRRHACFPQSLLRPTEPLATRLERKHKRAVTTILPEERRPKWLFPFGSE
jgi:hypothetical protein